MVDHYTHTEQYLNNSSLYTSTHKRRLLECIPSGSFTASPESVDKIDIEDHECHDDFCSVSSMKSMSDPVSPEENLCAVSDCPAELMSNSRKDKSCFVCGDKALGYNFSAISCESCKAFFRRSAHKIIRGRCEGKCDVTVESRSFCRKCRLAKCFSVGMKKEMILNDEQKKHRNQKIIINKLRRHGHLPPEDTYSASAKDLLCPIMDVSVSGRSPGTGSSLSPSRVKQEVFEFNRCHHTAMSSPSWSNTSVGTEFPGKSPDCHSNDCRTAVLLGSKSSSENGKLFVPWKNSQDHVPTIINMMSQNDQTLINEMIAAMEAGSFLVMSSSSLKMIPSNPEEFINMAELFVRKVIKVAKNITFFKQLHKNDQISLLKGSVVDIMMLRSAINYDPFTESWSLNTKGCINQGSGQATGERISAEILKLGSNASKQLFMTYSKFIKSLMFTIHGDLLALRLLILMSLFSADRMPMIDHKKVQEIQERYAHILEEYLSLSFNQESTLFARVVMKLTDLRNINEVHSKMLFKMKVDEFEPLLLEIFDLPADVDCIQVVSKVQTDLTTFAVTTVT